MSSAADVVELDEERVKRGSLKENTAETAGALLRVTREAQGLTIDQVSEATNIRSAHVESIEKMAIDKLPVAAYTTGFVRAYAQLLELPADQLVNRFREEAGYGRSSIAPQVNMPSRRDLAGGKELSLLAVVAILAFIIWVAWQVLREPEPAGPVQIAGTPLQERPIDARTAMNGGTNEVPMTRPTPNRDVEPIPGMPVDEQVGQTGLNEAADSAEVPVEGIATDAVELLGIVEPTDGTPVATEIATGPANSENGSVDASVTETPAAETAETATTQQEDAGIAPVDEPAASEPEIAAELDETEVADPVSETPDVQDASEAGLASVIDAEAEPAQQGIVGEAAPGTGEAAAVTYTEPVSLSRVSPIYPRRCERLSEGTETIVVTYDISSRGQPVNTRVTQSSNECFNAAAVSAVSRWTFEPATRNGNPIPVYTRSTRFQFDLPQ